MKITAEQKRYQAMTRQMGCVATGSHQTQLHHVMGRTAKHNKIWIGQWFVLPIRFDLHDVHSNNELNITHHRHKFTARYGTQAELWLKRHEALLSSGGSYAGFKLPEVSQEIIDAIMSSGY